MITDQMVEKGAKVLSPFAFERDEDGSYTYGEDARDEARRDVRKILTAALGDAVVVQANRDAIIEECARVAEGPIYKEKYRGKEGHNWWHETQGGNDSQYGNGRHAAAADIRALAVTRHNGGGE
jgi:hypothetical protein